jgi:lipid II:glycine glycyltransferase (peptidoglycan interpeptide bridge formation enzyme)
MPVIEVDLKEVLAKMEQRLERIEQILQSSLTELKVGQARLEEKVDGLSKRLENQEFISRGVLIALIVTILGGFAKLFGLIGNP